MSDVRLVWRPLERWPREQTRERECSPFRRKDTRTEIGWTDTEWDLVRELNQLGAREAIIQLAMTEADLRIDGQVRANARLSHPGVVVTFTAPGKGVLTFACDRWTTWQANIRGIAKGLEALRLLDRYGIVETAEQYTGWKEIGAGTPMGGVRAEPEPMSLQEAGRMVAGWVSGPHDLEVNARTAIEDVDYRKYAHRQAARRLHPDTGGTAEQFRRLEEAMTVLEANDA